jgi:hypothetical protein
LLSLKPNISNKNVSNLKHTWLKSNISAALIGLYQLKSYDDDMPTKVNTTAKSKTRRHYHISKTEFEMQKLLYCMK